MIMGYLLRREERGGERKKQGCREKRVLRLLIEQVPAFSPFPSCQILRRSLDTPRTRFEEPESPDYTSCDESEESDFGSFGESSRFEDEVIEEYSNHQNREPKCR